MVMSQEIAVARQKLQHTIEDVFKTQIECGSRGSIDPNKIENGAKLRNLERILMSRLLLPDQTQSRRGSHESKEDLLTKDTTTTDDRSLLLLSGLDLTVDCLADFSVENLNGQTTLDNEKQALNAKCMSILDINLSKNSLRSIPIALIGMFANLEVLDLSENHFESVYLSHLSRFGRLKKINLSSNFIKFFTNNPTDKPPAETTNTTADQFWSPPSTMSFDPIDSSKSSLLFTVEHLNLANNQLVSSNCIIISQFRNLK